MSAQSPLVIATFTQEQRLTGVENQINYKFNDRNCFWGALQAPGSGVLSVGTRRLTSEGNKRLALKGDAAIKYALVERWCATGCSSAEADRILQTRVSNDNIQRLCQDHGIDQFINLNPSQQGYCSPRLKTDTLEAILGAVVEDGGYEALKDVMLRLGMLP